MQKLTLILAAAAGYLFFSNKKSTEKKIEEVKETVENNTAYVEAKIQQKESEKSYSSYLKFTKCELRIRHLAGSKCYYKFTVAIKNTASVSIKVKDVIASIYIYGTHTTNVSNYNSLTIAPNSTKEFIVGSGGMEGKDGAALSGTRGQIQIMKDYILEKFKKDIAKQCGKKLFSNAYLLKRARGKSVDITADCALSVVSTAGIAGQTVSQKDVEGKAVYSSPNGDYSPVGYCEMIK